MCVLHVVDGVWRLGMHVDKIGRSEDGTACGFNMLGVGCACVRGIFLYENTRMRKKIHPDSCNT